jgi:uncharacterized coiled-coil DUF342 family protein
LDLIPAIDPKAFSKFETLEISNSTITKLEKKFFKNAVEAKSLVLDYVKLLRIPVDFFENLHKVEEIVITDCELQNLTQPIFDSLKEHLKSLTLKGNEIDIVNPLAIKNLNLQAGEFHDQCAGNVKFSDVNLTEGMRACYQNFEVYTSKKVDKLSLKLYDTMDKLSSMETAMTKKIAELERKLQEEAGKTEVFKLNTNNTIEELSEMKQIMVQQIVELDRKLRESKNKAEDLKLNSDNTAKKIVELERKLQEEANKTEILKLNTNNTIEELSEMKQTMSQQIVEFEKKLNESDNKAEEHKLSANDTAKKIVELENKLQEEANNSYETMAEKIIEDNEIRVLIQDLHTIIICLILLSFVGAFSFIAMWWVNKKPLHGTKKQQ